MPQMAPYNWLYLNIYFTMILFIYFLFLSFTITTYSNKTTINLKTYSGMFNLMW